MNETSGAQQSANATSDGLATLLREAMADPLSVIDHWYRPAPQDSFADIIIELPHLPGCWRCRVEQALGESIPNALERYRDALSRGTP